MNKDKFSSSIKWDRDTLAKGDVEKSMQSIYSCPWYVSFQRTFSFFFSARTNC